MSGPSYILLLERAGEQVQLATGSNNKYVVAREGNDYLLHEIGQSLMDDGIIVGYQLAQLVGAPVRNY